MVISSNRRAFVTPTPTTEFGKLTTIGSPLNEGTNELFLGFKPASVCKKAGFLRVTGSGYYLAPMELFDVSLYLQFSRPGVQFFDVKVLSLRSTKTDTHYFSFHVDIPVGTMYTQTETAYATSNENGNSKVFQSLAYISADIDDVWTASLRYTRVPAEPVFPHLGDIKVTSLVTEYLEN